ncbi:MAG: CapA family protein [Christensenellaceae bacterium]|nr:CapA family protein [Christensenellaceae bacterium]
MSRPKKRRGISVGTILMLVVTIAVTGCTVFLLRLLMGETGIEFNTSQVLEALNLGNALPALSLSEIPMGGDASQPTDAPGAIPMPQAPQATAQPTQAPTATPVSGGTVTLTLGGSINMDDGIRQSGYYSDAKKYDFSETLSLLSGEMRGNLTMVTLENIVVPSAKVSSLITPADIMTTLADVGVDVVALGFQQAYDQGLTGVKSTVEAVEDTRKMVSIGAFASAELAADVRVIPVNGVKVALMHYTESLSSKGRTAMKKDGCSFAVPLLDIAKVHSDITAAKARGAEIIVVSVDWTNATKSTPTKAQIEMAQQIADAGADVIVGTGTRVAQPVTWLTAGNRQVLCAYSLGSLLNDGRKDGNVASLLLQLTISTDGAGNVTFKQVAYTPTYIWRYRLDGKYYYRVVASDQAPPMGMGDDQAGYKDKAFANIKKTLGDDTPLTLR